MRSRSAVRQYTQLLSPHKQQGGGGGSIGKRKTASSSSSSLRKLATRVSAKEEGRREGVKPSGFEQVLFIETGSGCDQHGQDATKACVRACRNAIEFNSIPSIAKLVPGGYASMKLHVKLGTPMPGTVDVSQVKKVFPYGQAHIEVVEGGLKWSSGIAIDELGDKNDDAITAVAAVTVGY